MIRILSNLLSALLLNSKCKSFCEAHLHEQRKGVGYQRVEDLLRQINPIKTLTHLPPKLLVILNSIIIKNLYPISYWSLALLSSLYFFIKLAE